MKHIKLFESFDMNNFKEINRSEYFNNFNKRKSFDIDSEEEIKKLLKEKYPDGDLFVDKNEIFMCDIKPNNQSIKIIKSDEGYFINWNFGDGYKYYHCANLNCLFDKVNEL